MSEPTPEQRFWEQTAQDARIKRVSRMIPDTDTPLSDFQLREVVNAVRAYMSEFDITQAEVARAIGESETYVSNVLGLKNTSLPAAKRDELIRKLNHWIEADFRQRSNKRPEGFVHIATAKAIIEAARNVREVGTIGTVVGAAGLGKTLTARWLAGAGDSQLPGTMLVPVDQDCRNAMGLLRKVYAASKLRRNTRKHPALADVIPRLAGSGRLLIIDQAHDLANVTAFKLIQDLHDACELPIMLLGTVDINERTQDDQDPQFGQLSSRIGLRVDLRSVTMRLSPTKRRLQWISADELSRIFDRGKINFHPDTLRALVPIANWEPGHLRRVKWLVRYAEAAARGDKSNLITIKHLETAIKIVKGEAVKIRLPDEEGAQAATA